jgi:hypothetical protein
MVVTDGKFLIARNKLVEALYNEVKKDPLIKCFDETTCKSMILGQKIMGALNYLLKEKMEKRRLYRLFS